MSLSGPGFDTRFTLPAVDDPAAVEIGVILLGLDAERLLAGLGLAGAADDPTLVTLMVDQVRHGARPGTTMAAIVAAGVDRWRAARPVLAAAGPGPAAVAVREAWVRAAEALPGAAVTAWGPAGRAYLTACWLRASEVDSHVGYLEDPPCRT